MKVQKTRLDSKGRIGIPNVFRDVLGLKKGETVVLQLDKENERLLLFPIEKSAKKISFFIGDDPGSLANIAKILASNNVDIVYSESRSTKRKSEAVWEVVADFSKTDLAKLKKDLKKAKSVKRFKIEKLSN